MRSSRQCKLVLAELSNRSDKVDILEHPYLQTSTHRVCLFMGGVNKNAGGETGSGKVFLNETIRNVDNLEEWSGDCFKQSFGRGKYVEAGFRAIGSMLSALSAQFLAWLILQEDQDFLEGRRLGKTG
jgi:hypothetical protein